MTYTHFKKLFLSFALGATMSAAAAETWHTIAKDDLGKPGKQPYLTKSDGNYRINAKGLADADATIAYGNPVQLVYKDIDPTAQYRLKLRFVCDAGNRKQSVVVNGETLKKPFKLKKGKVTQVMLDIPQPVANKGTLKVEIRKQAGVNAVLSSSELLSSEKQKVAKLKKGEKLEVEQVKVPVPRFSPIPTRVAAVKQFQKSLDGVWKFTTTAPAKMEELRAAADWADIKVPGEWSMQGFHVEKNQAAAFFRTFTLPADWQGQLIKLRFDAVYSDSVVYVNGKKAGAHLGGFTAFELDVTDLVTFGADNTLSLSVKNESLADSLASGSKYACHPLGGIPRSVSLLALPQVYMSGLAVQPALDDQYKNATLTALIDLSNEAAADAGDLNVNIELKPWKSDQAIKLSSNSVSAAAIAAGQTANLKFEVPVTNPAKWTCETPNLYVLTCTLTQGGKVLQTVNQRFGFREIEVKGADILVNGMPIALRGTNRHEVYPLTGRSVPKHLYRKDVELFRAGNVNLIRTCHYQPDRALMEAADELGMFIECEGPYCWAHTAKGYPERDVIEATVRQNLEMVQFLRNHPSILYWSLGNESRWNAAFEQSAKSLAKLDPTRPLCFDTWNHDGNELCKVGTKHYPGLKETYGKGAYPKQLGEYCHLNSYNRHEMATDQALRDKWGIYLHRMWESMYADPTCAGGSTWAGIDDTFYWDFKNEDGTIEERTVGYGTWGPIDGWRRPKPEYWGMKKSYSPVRIAKDAIKVAAGEIIIPVENRQDFSNLNRLQISWKLGAASGTVAADIKPRSKGELRIKANAASAGELELTFNDPRGFTVDTFKLPLGTQPVAPKATGNESYTVNDTADAIVVKGKETSYTINRKTGLFESPSFTGPYLMILPLNGKGGTQMHGPTKFYEPYTHTCSEWKPESVTHTAANGLPVITVKGAYKEAAGAFTYRFNNDGTFTVDYAFTTADKVNPRQLGIVFELPNSFENLSWKRKGYWSTYPEWHIARLEGTANANYGFVSTPVGHRTKPDHEWRHDRIEVGNHDFASTKHNVTSASLLDKAGNGLAITADADRHVRAWIHSKTHLRLLVAHYSNGGNERFLRRISKMDDKPLKKGDKVSASVKLRVK